MDNTPIIRKAFTFQAVVDCFESARPTFPEEVVTESGERVVTPCSLPIGGLFQDMNGEWWRVVRHETVQEAGESVYYFRAEVINGAEG